MIRESVTIDEVIGFLNHLITVDPGAITRLIEARVACNDAMTNHPTVQCGENEVGFLGVLNGIFGTYGAEAGSKEMYGPFTVHLSGHGEIIRFERTVPA